MTQWWYNDRTGDVEEGPQSLGSERIGPFDTREEALRAPETVAERSRAWAAEEDAADGRTTHGESAADDLADVVDGET